MADEACRSLDGAGVPDAGAAARRGRSPVSGVAAATADRGVEAAGLDGVAAGLAAGFGVGIFSSPGTGVATAL